MSTAWRYEKIIGISYLLLLKVYISFLFIQVTPKTLADVKGGTLISYEGRTQV